MFRAARSPSQIAPYHPVGVCKPWPALALPPSVLWNREFLAKDWPWRMTDGPRTFAKKEIIDSTANSTNAKWIALQERGN
jgi:hypothetical protein